MMGEIIERIKKYKIIIIVLIILVLVIIFNLLLNSSSTNTIYTVKRENLVNTVLINGTYTIASQTSVNSPTNGVITKLYVKNGTEVKKGDPLFYVNSSATADQIKTAYANYLAANSQLQADNAMLYSLQSTMYSAWQAYINQATNATYQNNDGSPNSTNRIQTTFTVPQSAWLAAEANYKNQQVVINKDQAALSSALQAYNETQSVTVTAPAAGQIVNLSAALNDQVSAVSSQTSPSNNTTISPVLIIADFSNPVIISSVDQVNIPRLKIGQKASIVFDALPNQTFTGSVSSIDTAGTKVQGTVDFNVNITVNNVTSMIRPNMTTSVTIETGRADNVLTIPNDAIISKNGKTYVELENKNLSEVTLGLKGLTKTEVINGLSSGDRIIEQQ